MAHLRGFRPSKTSIGIIGAGAAGLCTAHVFAEAGYRVRIIEGTKQIGGTWVYSPTPSPISSLYESLRCNIPKQGMAFSNHPFPSNIRSFPSHEDVLNYLRSYSERFQLSRYCTFNQTVKSVEKTQHRGTPMWKVTTDKGLEDFFHAVIICIGHYSKPHYVDIPGSKEFLAHHRNILHSHEYKTPMRFANRRVLVVGSGPSGIDISVELLEHASMVFVSHRKKGSCFPAENRNFPTEVPPVKFVTGCGDVHLTDGRILRDVQDILLCTGYEYSFPFLDDGTAGVSVSADGHAVHGLVRHCIAAKDPTIAFVGLPWSVIPFPLFEDQAHFLAASYDMGADLSRFAKILGEEKVERQAAELKGRYYHRLGDEQWEYRRQLADFAGRPLVDASLVELLRDATASRRRDPTQYREREYHVLGPGPGQWRVTEGGVDVTGRDDPASPNLTANNTSMELKNGLVLES